MDLVQTFTLVLVSFRPFFDQPLSNADQERVKPGNHLWMLLVTIRKRFTYLRVSVVLFSFFKMANMGQTQTRLHNSAECLQ